MVDHAEDICRHVEHNILIMRIVTVVLPLLLHLLNAEGRVGHVLVLPAAPSHWYFYLLSEHFHL